MKLLALSGSARKASANKALLQVMSKLCIEDSTISVIHNLNSLPVFSPDLEGDQTPSIIDEFIKAVELADGIIISSPEYVRAIPGGLRNAIDWLVSGEAIINKPIALIHASHRGDDMLASLRLVLGTVTAEFQPRIFKRFPLVSKSPKEVQDFFQLENNIMELRNFVREFVSVIAK